jgi:hypothetical protein
MRRRAMNVEYFFGNPKVMAGSGLLAMLLKLMLCSLLALPMVFLLVECKSTFGAVLLLLYPIMALVVDVFLYRFRDKLWDKTPEPETIPQGWDITQEQLVEYTKNLPKVRLMRFLMCWFILPFAEFEPGSVLIGVLSNLTAGFFICSFFDWVWLSIFKLKRPHFIIKPIKSKPLSSLFEDSFSRRRQEILRDSDPSLLGSSAWIARKNRESFKR